MKPIYSKDAESAILGACLEGNEKCVNEVRSKLSEEDFFHPAYKIIFRAINEIDGTVDLSSVFTWLQEAGFSKTVPSSELSELATKSLSVLLFDGNIKTVLELSKRRRLQGICGEILCRIESGEDYESIASDAERSILSTGQVAVSRADILTGNEIWDCAYDKICEIEKLKLSGDGALTGMPTFDYDVGGLQRGQFIIMGARSNQGKTQLALSWMANVLKQGKPCGFVSLESSVSSLAIRMLCHQTGSYANSLPVSTRGVPLDSVRLARMTPLECEKIQASRNVVSDWPAHIIYSPGADLAQVTSTLRKMAKTHGCHVVFLDYLQLIKVSGKDSRERIEEASKGIAMLARELDICLVALAQLNRNANSEKPKLSDLDGSSQIEKDADQIWFLWREMREDGIPKLIGDLFFMKGRDVWSDGFKIIVDKGHGLVLECPREIK